MSQVDIRWRPSGGRGEYEHVPSDVIMDRRVIIDPVSVPGSLITTDVTGRLRDGKPRIRRENPNDRNTLNLAPLISALALLPSPRREDTGTVSLPLRDNEYVVSSITFNVRYNDNGDAICTPMRLQVLHDQSSMNIFDRLRRVRALIEAEDTPEELHDLTTAYANAVRLGTPSSDVRTISDRIIDYLLRNPDLADQLDAPSVGEVVDVAATTGDAIVYHDLTADETKRRLVSHYRIDRDPAIRKAKIAQFKHAHGDVHCENCHFSFGIVYGQLGSGYIEVHHKKMLASLLPNEVTSLSDLVLLCSNCHRMTHRKRQPLTMDELQAATVNPPVLTHRGSLTDETERSWGN